MKTSNSLAVLATVCALAAPAIASADPVEDFYKDKQLTLIVGYETGGGYDSYARTLIRHMPQNIPGKPNIIIRNMPGAGSLVATNFLYNQAPKDGTLFAAVGREMPTAALFGQDNIRFKTEEFVWIGNMESTETFCGAWHTAGITKAEELFEKPLIVGGTNGDSVTVTQPIALNNLLGTKFKVIAGYRGGADMHLALQRGEIEGRCAWSYSSLQTAGPTWIQDGTVKVLLVAGLKRSKRFPDVPIAPELAKTSEARQALELLLSQDIMARPYLAPPKVPADRTAALRKAFDATVEDAAFVADIKKQRLDLSPMSGEEMEQIIVKLYATPKALVERAIAATKKSDKTEMKSLPSAKQ
jgi:tripartite-type tricarboxylate transporter receptor subunit TctC